MNRSKKCCAYRDCDTDSITHPDRTLFQFPKDQQRVNRWCDAAGLDPLASGPRFMCDLHFSRIYMCFSSRRKMLLNTAVPIRYGSEETEETDPDQEVQSSSQDILIDEEHLDESMEQAENEIANEIVYMSDMAIEEDDDDDDEEKTEQSPQKRPTSNSEATVKTKIIKIESLPTTVTSSSPTEASKHLTPPKGTILKRVKLKKRPRDFEAGDPVVVTRKIVKVESAFKIVAAPTESTVSSTPTKTASTSAALNAESPKKPVDSVKTIKATSSSISSGSVPKSKDDSPRKENPAAKEWTINEFIFKGQEYVQLPKAMYNSQKEELEQHLAVFKREKMQMQKKLEMYRKTLHNLKRLINDVMEDE